MTRLFYHPIFTRTSIIVIITTCLLVGFSTHAQSIKLLRGPSFEIALKSDSSLIRIPITLAADSGTLNLRLIDVSFDNPVRTISTTPFDGKIETDSFKNSFLAISVNNKSRLEQGKYHLLFNIFKSKPGSPPEPFTIDLTVKPATLAPIANVVVSRIQCAPWSSYTPAYKPLTLFENSHNAIISPITIRELTLTDAKGANIPARISFPDSGQVVYAGRQADLSYKIDGELPIGTATGTFELDSPQLAAPVQFKMDIITKRGGWWIVIIIMAGLLFGYITRIVLENILNLNRARKEAVELSDILEEEKANRPDKDFGLAIDKLEKKLRFSRRTKTSDITAAITSVKTELADAITAFNTHQAGLQTKLQSFSDALSGIWYLPLAVETIIVTASNSLKNVNAALAANNPGEGTTLLGQLNDLMAKDFSTESIKLKRQFASAFQSMKQSTLKIAVAPSPLLDAINAQATAAVAIPEDKFEETPANIRSFLQLLSGLRRQTSHLFYNLSLTTGSLVENLNTTLLNGQVDLQKELEDIRIKADTKFNLPPDKALETSLALVEADMKEIQQDIVNALTSDKLGLKEEQVRTITGALASGQYIDAANKLVDFKKPVTTTESHSVNESGRMPVTSRAIPSLSLQPAGFVVEPVAVSLLTNNNDRSYSSILRSIFWTSLLQTLLIGVGIAIFGYMLFQEKFTGTITDMVEIFSWAFVLDVSLNTLTTVSGTVPKKIKA